RNDQKADRIHGKGEGRGIPRKAGASGIERDRRHPEESFATGDVQRNHAEPSGGRVYQTGKQSLVPGMIAGAIPRPAASRQRRSFSRGIRNSDGAAKNQISAAIPDGNSASKE